MKCLPKQSALICCSKAHHGTGHTEEKSTSTFSSRRRLKMHALGPMQFTVGTLQAGVHKSTCQVSRIGEEVK